MSVLDGDAPYADIVATQFSHLWHSAYEQRGDTMRTGAEYREALRDGRRVWVMGEGLVDDVTTHPATSAMVEEYVAWYDRHFDPAWQDILLAPPAPAAKRDRLGLPLPKTSDDLIGMGRSFAKTIFLSPPATSPTPRPTAI